MDFELREDPQSFQLNGSDGHRCIFIADCNESLHDVSDEDIQERLFEQLENDGHPVRGLSCHHAHDCCGQWYPGSMEIIHVDRSYDMVIIAQDIHQNV
jgi:hypothetical protein